MQAARISELELSSPRPFCIPTRERKRGNDSRARITRYQSQLIDVGDLECSPSGYVALGSAASAISYLHDIIAILNAARDVKKSPPPEEETVINVARSRDRTRSRLLAHNEVSRRQNSTTSASRRENPGGAKRGRDADARIVKKAGRRTLVCREGTSSCYCQYHYFV